MADDLFDYDEDEPAPKKRDNLFIWTVFILLLIGLAFACWLGSFYIFGHPEQARNYRILQKMKKIDPPKRFEITKAPPGEYMSAKRLFETYSKYSTLQLQRENEELLRTYVTNYRETKKLVPYASGDFTIADAELLTGKDFITSGMVAIGVSNDSPQVLIEHLYPMKDSEITKARPLLTIGNPIILKRTYDHGAIIHIERVADGRMQFTVVPLTYGSYALNGGVGTFSTEPPRDLHVEGGLPITTAVRVDAAMKKFADYRRIHPAAEPESPEPRAPQIVRLDNPDGTKIPATGSLPEIPVATPIPLAGKGAAMPRKVPVEVATLAGAAKPLATATPVPNLPTGVFKPFIASKPDSNLPSAQGNSWRTFKPGALPPGRAVSTEEVVAMEGATLSATTYLRGNFIVTARAGNFAVLRPRAGATGTADTTLRIMVEYPNGSAPPEEGASVDRNEVSGYEIRDIRKGATGETTIRVRELVEQ